MGAASPYRTPKGQAEFPVRLTREECGRLEFILTMTDPDRRMDVAIAWTGIASRAEIGRRAGMHQREVDRWLRRESPMPFGAAFRIADIFGVEAGVLLAHYLDIRRGKSRVRESD